MNMESVKGPSTIECDPQTNENLNRERLEMQTWSSPQKAKFCGYFCFNLLLLLFA